jgi:hypothetical protein
LYRAVAENIPVDNEKLGAVNENQVLVTGKFIVNRFEEKRDV